MKRLRCALDGQTRNAPASVQGAGEAIAARTYPVPSQPGPRHGDSHPTKFELVINPKASFCVRLPLSERWFLLCVTGEDEVACFDLIVAGEAGFHERL